MRQRASVAALVLCLGGAAWAFANGQEDDGQMGRRSVYPALRSLAALETAGVVDAGLGVYPRLSAPSALAFPTPSALHAARRYAAGRTGRVSFAVTSPTGATSGRALEQPFTSASVVKALILVAYLNRLEEQGRAPTPPERDRLAAMIRTSDNDSATAIFRRLGPAAIRDLAARAGLRSFSVGAHWGEAQITAADQARFFLRLDGLLAPPRRASARRLLRTVVAEQSWGIPAASRPRWRTYFKGGWRPERTGDLVNQAALLERGTRRLALAVLTESNPSQKYGAVTIEGIARRLLQGS